MTLLLHIRLFHIDIMMNPSSCTCYVYHVRHYSTQEKVLISQAAFFCRGIKYTSSVLDLWMKVYIFLQKNDIASFKEIFILGASTLGNLLAC